MATNIRIGKLDFDDIKLSLKTYLSQQTEFSDYDFEGSGMSQLVNLLAYNAHYDALSANFLANEVFLDTATKRSSIVSRAKELGYTPRSRRASTATITLSLRGILNEGTPNEVEPIVPRGTRFTTKVNDEIFTFTTLDAITLTKSVDGIGTLFSATFKVYEGVLVQHTTPYNAVDDTTAIPNTDIDTTTLKVEVGSGLTWSEYTQPSNFLTVTSTTTIYMIQEGFNGFEIYFGDGVLGKKPSLTDSIRMTYVVTSGSTANGAALFSLASTIDGILSNTVVSVVASAPSSGGLVEEALESIRFNAKSTFSSQNRAVTASDYAALAQQNFSSIKTVLAWDGADNEPPKYGRVVLCVQPALGDVLSTTEKTLVAQFLQAKSVGNVKIDFVDPEYVNVELYSKVKYNPSELKVGVYELGFITKTAIGEYAATSIQKFKGTLRYSALLAAIDDSNYAITGNETTAKLSKVLKPNLYTVNSFRFSFSNNIKPGTVSSSIFYDGISPNKLYLKDSSGVLHVYYSNQGSDVLYTAGVGTIDYSTGLVIISNLNLSIIENTKFKVYATPVNMDITSSKNVILNLKQEDIVVDIIKDA